MNPLLFLLLITQFKKYLHSAFQVNLQNTTVYFLPMTLYTFALSPTSPPLQVFLLTMVFLLIRMSFCALSDKQPKEHLLQDPSQDKLCPQRSHNHTRALQNNREWLSFPKVAMCKWHGSAMIAFCWGWLVCSSLTPNQSGKKEVVDLHDQCLISV